MVVTAVEHVGEGSIPGLILTHICIEQIHRNDMAGLTGYAILPSPHMDRAPFDIDRGLLVDQLRKIIDWPRGWLLALPAVRIHTLKKYPRRCSNDTATIGTSRSAADRIVSPASTPSPPE